MSEEPEDYDYMHIGISSTDSEMQLRLQCNYCSVEWVKRFPPTAVKYLLKRNYYKTKCPNCEKEFSLSLTQEDRKTTEDIYKKLEAKKHD